MDAEQTAPIQEQSDLGPHCLPQRLLKYFSRREKQTTFVAIGALRVKIKFQIDLADGNSVLSAQPTSEGSKDCAYPLSKKDIMANSEDTDEMVHNAHFIRVCTVCKNKNKIFTT